MQEALYIFLATGFVSMSAALSAGAINKLPEEQKPAFIQRPNGQVAVIMAGNFAALTLIAAMAYGILSLEWYIPVSCLFITFPAVHMLLVQRLLGAFRGLILMTPLVLAAAVALYLFWP